MYICISCDTIIRYTRTGISWYQSGRKYKELWGINMYTQAVLTFSYIIEFLPFYSINCCCCCCCCLVFLLVLVCRCVYKQPTNLYYCTILDGNIRNGWPSYLYANGPYIFVQRGTVVGIIYKCWCCY